MLRVNSFLLCIPLKMFGIVYGWLNLAKLAIILVFVSIFCIGVIKTNGEYSLTLKISWYNFFSHLILVHFVAFYVTAILIIAFFMFSTVDFVKGIKQVFISTKLFPYFCITYLLISGWSSTNVVVQNSLQLQCNVIESISADFQFQVPLANHDRKQLQGKHAASAAIWTQFRGKLGIVPERKHRCERHSYFYCRLHCLVDLRKYLRELTVHAGQG